MQPCGICYWCHTGREVVCIEIELRLKDERNFSEQFEDAHDVWSRYGYIYANKKYGQLPSFIGGTLGPSLYVPNH